MPSADLLIPFFLASAVFACVPGPGMSLRRCSDACVGPEGRVVVGFWFPYCWSRTCRSRRIGVSDTAFSLSCPRSSR